MENFTAMNENLTEEAIPTETKRRPYRSILVYPNTHKLVAEYCIKEGYKMSAWVDARILEAITRVTG